MSFSEPPSSTSQIQNQQKQPSASGEEQGNAGGFFDKFVAKIKKLSSDENPVTSFDEVIPVSGLLGSTSKFSLTAATDVARLLQEINAATQCPQNAGDIQKICDETFTEIAEIVKLIEVTISNERYNLQRAQYCKELAKPVSEAIKRELAALDHFLQLNLRVKITRNNNTTNNNNNNSTSEGGNENPKSIHVEVFKKWTDHSETCVQKLEKIDEERKKWDDIIERLEKA